MAHLLKIINKQRKPLIVLLSIILTLLAGLLDKESGAEVSVSLIYLLPIALCSWFVNKWSGIIISILSAVVFFTADKLTYVHHSHPLIIYWNTLIELGFFVTLSLSLSRLRKSIDLEFNMAMRIQKGLLPQQLPVLKNYSVSAYWQPKSFVSGDYYDFININKDKIGFCIGDVAGHGVAAALLMSNFQAHVRQVSKQNESSDLICRDLNNILFKNIMHDKFVSFFFGILNLKDNTFEYTNAGHPAGLIINKHGKVKKLDRGGAILGVVSDHTYERDLIKLTKGDTLIFYTDGLIESKNIKGEFFGEERFIDACIKHYSYNVNAMKKNIVDSVTEFCTGVFNDDVTLLIISTGRHEQGL